MKSLLTLAIASALGGEPASAGTAPSGGPSILASRQLLDAERLAVGDVVLLSSDPSGAKPQPFQIVGVYEPAPDPARLGEARLEVRLHLPDLIALTSDPSDPASADAVRAINVRLVDYAEVDTFSRDLSARLPGLGLIAHPTTAHKDEADPFVVLERFHLAIALVTVIASSIFLLALMVMLVDERRGTVATLRLIGLRRRRILQQVLVEGLLIAVVGAASGVVLAAVLQGGFNRFFQWRYDTSLVFVRVTRQIAWRSVLFAVPLGILASLVSSWTLVRREGLSLPSR